ncbi:MAG: ADP-ribosylation factor-like protein [Myxococcota bacterium]
MPQLNVEAREITLKVVYYGPALSGKTTNLRQIHARLAAGMRSEMVTLDTQDDRTLYFDFLPVEFGADGDFKIKLKLFTVPGQVLHRSTRRVVLAGADAVVFVADSQRSASSGNAYSYRDLEANLRANGLDITQMPTVVQFNKRDLPDIKPLEEIRKAWEGTGIPTIPGSAAKGEGVIETLEALLQRLFRQLDQRHAFGQKFGMSEEQFMRDVMRHFEEQKSA